jgi:hypothetical protein
MNGNSTLADAQGGGVSTRLIDIGDCDLCALGNIGLGKGQAYSARSPGN